MNRKKHENVSDFVDNVAGGQTHKVSDGAYTGYGSSRSLADRAYEEAKKTNREYVAYGVDPKEDMLGIWNHYGSTREQNHEPNKDEPPAVNERKETRPPEEPVSYVGLDGGGGWLIKAFGFVVIMAIISSVAPGIGKAAEVLFGLAIMIGVVAIVCFVLYSIYTKVRGVL